MNSTIIRTVIPIIILIGIGVFSRKIKILKAGDERVFSAYVYYFALPALFFINITEINFTREILRFILAGIVPILIVLMIYIILYFIFKFTKNTLYLLIFSTVFGSLAFFGIPFIMFAFPTEYGEHLAILSSSFISIVSVTIAITVLELYKIEKSTIWKGFRSVLKRLSRNPLIISILSGIVLSIAGITVPSFLSTVLHMLGKTTATVAIFMLGVFLYGRKYKNIARAFKLSLLRIAFLPLIAFLVTKLFELPGMERSTLVLMHSMPVAVSMIILSERYNFYQETIASLTLISSISAVVYLNVWLLVVGV